jgi:hypothetical protein
MPSYDRPADGLAECGAEDDIAQEVPIIHESRRGDITGGDQGKPRGARPESKK